MTDNCGKKVNISPDVLNNRSNQSWILSFMEDVLQPYQLLSLWTSLEMISG